MASWGHYIKEDDISMQQFKTTSILLSALQYNLHFSEKQNSFAFGILLLS